MKTKPIDTLPTDTQDVMKHVFQEAFGNPIIFDSAPTNAEMNANSWGVFLSDLYIKFGNGICLRIAGTSI